MLYAPSGRGRRSTRYLPEVSYALRYPQPTTESASVVMRANRKTDTEPEVALRRELHRRGHRFRKNAALGVEGPRVLADVVFPRCRVAVFVDGCFWHACPDHGTQPKSNSWYWGPKLRRNVERDMVTTRRLTMAGWQVVRIWEHMPVWDAADLVESVLAPLRDAICRLGRDRKGVTSTDDCRPLGEVKRQGQEQSEA